MFRAAWMIERAKLHRLPAQMHPQRAGELRSTEARAFLKGAPQRPCKGDKINEIAITAFVSGQGVPALLVSAQWTGPTAG